MGPLAHYALMRLKVRLSYRGDLIIQVLGHLLVASVGLVFLGAVFHRVPDIRGWTLHEVLFIWGMAETATALLFTFFQGLWSLNRRYLLGGELDRVLLRPLDPYTQVMLDNLSPQYLPGVGLGLVMIGLATQGLPPISLVQWALLPVFLASSLGVLAGVLTAVSAAGFRVHHRGTAVGLVYQSAVFSRYPLPIFAWWLQHLLTWVVPFGFVGFYPALWYLGRGPEGPPLWVQPAVGLGVFLVGRLLWELGRRGYRSTGT